MNIAGALVLRFTETERRYLESLVEEDVKAIASDIVEAQSRRAVGDERRLRLAHQEALHIQSMFTLNTVEISG